MKKLIIALILGALLTGCASSPSMKQIAEDETRASEIRANANEDRRAQEQKRMEANVSRVPAWALEQPRPDETGVYAIGMAESDKMRVAIRKAMLEAEFGLAKIYNQELSGSERAYSQDGNGSVGNEQYTELIDKLVSQVSVVGFEVVRQEVKPIDGKYHAFVLLKLPYAQFNRALQEQRSKTDDRSVIQAFDDLEGRLNRRRQQRQEDARQQPTKDTAKQPAASAPASKSADRIAEHASTDE